MDLRRGLKVSTAANKMATKVNFTCANGNSLIGPSELTCLPSGNWSAKPPHCESKFNSSDLPFPIFNAMFVILPASLFCIS